MVAATVNDYNLVVGIDFGTIFSGYFILNSKNLQVSDDASLGSSLLAEKAMPSTIYYKSHAEREYRYGESALEAFENNPNSGHYVSKVKLWLSSTDKRDLLPLPLNMTPIQVIADYLREMRIAIHERIGHHDPRNPFSYIYCMAVPTIWSEESKAILRKAAMLAGLVSKNDEPGKLLVVDEAVAAALGAEYMLPELGLTNGSLYMLCDLGGGTVNVATFEKDNSQGPRGLKEATVGTGGDCGSNSLDIRFEALLRKRITRYPDYEEENIRYILYYFNTEFKIEFGRDQEEDRALWMKQLNNYYLCGSQNISKRDVFKIDEIRTKVFDPVVNKAVQLVEEQFKQLEGKKLDAMFITGGFRQSPYLRARFRDTFRDRVEHFKVIGKGATSVMKGAALFGASPRILTQRILRHAYGIRLLTPTDSSDKSDAQDVKDKFHVYIHKGEPVKEDAWVTKKIAWNKDSLPAISLYSYEDNEPIPEYPTEKEIDLVAIFDAKPPTDERKGARYDILVINMRFGLNKIEVKANIGDREFEYLAAQDSTEETATWS